MIKVILKNIAIVLAFFLSFLAFFSAQWYVDIFGDIGFRSIIFTLFSPMEGTASGIVYDWLLKGLLPSVTGSVILSLFYFLKFKLKILTKISCKKSRSISPAHHFLKKFQVPLLFPLYRLNHILC